MHWMNKCCWEHVVYKILNVLFKFKLIISSYCQQLYFIRTGNNFAVNIKSKWRYIFNSKKHKLKFTQISFKPVQHISKIIFKIWKYML